MLDNAPLKKCECSPDCKEMIVSIVNTGKPRKYAKGHENLGRIYSNRKGYTIDKDGYILIYVSDHPYKTKSNCVREHRLIYEHYLKILFDEDIYIPLDYDIHHINGNKDDNSLINIIPLHKSIHRGLEGKTRQYKTIDTSERFCNLCGSYETKIRGKGKQRRGGGKRWYRDITGFLCINCYDIIREYKKKFGL